MNNKTRPMVLHVSLADNLGPEDDKMHDFGPKESPTKVGKSLYQIKPPYEHLLY
jgi:hypothetical protein